MPCLAPADSEQGVCCSVQCLPPLSPAAHTLCQPSKEDFYRDCHLGAIDVTGNLACTKERISEKIAVKMECAPGAILSLFEPSETWWREETRGYVVELSVRNEDEKNGPGTITTLNCCKMDNILLTGFSQGDQQLKTIHLVYK